MGSRRTKIPFSSTPNPNRQSSQFFPSIDMPSESVNNGGSSGPRYAPEDPTLPLPWKGLVDGSTGYIYYWNTETNVTQYEKPVKDKEVASKKAVNSSVHREDVRKAEKRVDRKSRNNQYQDDRLYDSRLSIELRGSGHSAHSSREPAKGDSHSDANGSLLGEAYCRKNEITAIMGTTKKTQKVDNMRCSFYVLINNKMGNIVVYIQKFLASKFCVSGSLMKLPNA